MDAITLLKADHDKVKRLLDGARDRRPNAGSRPARELFATIKGELTVHEIIEEEIFYPELKAHPKAKDIVLEGYEEHHVVDLLMGELESLDVQDETWGAKALVMKENVEHHMEEEEGDMFRKARQVFDRDELVDLGRADGRAKAVGQRELNIPDPDAADHGGRSCPSGPPGSCTSTGAAGSIRRPRAARSSSCTRGPVRHGRAQRHLLPDAVERDVPVRGQRASPTASSSRSRRAGT